MTPPCPKCNGVGKRSASVYCDCITGVMRRDEDAKGYDRSQVPPLCTGAQTTAGAIRSRALYRRRASIAALVMARRAR